MENKINIDLTSIIGEQAIKIKVMEMIVDEQKKEIENLKEKLRVKEDGN